MPIGKGYKRSIRQEERIKPRLNFEILESVEAPRHVCLNKKFSVACGTIYSCLPLVLVAEMTERSHFNRVKTRGGGAERRASPYVPRNMMRFACVSQQRKHTHVLVTSRSEGKTVEGITEHQTKRTFFVFVAKM